MSFGVGIIGCGLIGQKRAKALGEGRLVACADIDEARAKALAGNSGAKVFGDWRGLLTLPVVDIVVIATLHDSLAEITLAAIEAGKHVLVEKPAARNPTELEPVMAAVAARHDVKVHVGFNHRYHRAFRKARELFEAGALGELMFIRARYGHGGRIGYDKEWRSKPDLSGGGELIDQGPHLIDLSRWFLGEFTEVQGFAHTYYWDMPVDDNGFLLLKTAKQQVAFLHASCTEWKNMFSMEIYGRNAKLEISGLGGSYGVERLTYYKMLPEMGPPETTAWEYPMGDDSWSVEMAEFYDDIRLNRQPAAGLNDAFEALKVVEKIYKESGYDHCP
ncbi:MAG: Gfo/Idh/MocA family oxidoreductase [Sulfuricaulis sp.]|uniref:Gfo/Idh/MocA family protein n=1 Tax=Sulfuricaulis sp. TaxID=2003553 RepID=UPI0025FDD0D0|nr:Gfo/Idh/MocA family oxidoreductase [Sulfuricaulis sp.]MCR4348012.1 Gfo/Idh/MocA family oxidoreductase [Sulfuricaulis sp.]